MTIFYHIKCDAGIIMKYMIWHTLNVCRNQTINLPHHSIIAGIVFAAITRADLPEGSNQSGLAAATSHVSVCTSLLVQQLWTHMLLSLYLSLSIYNHTNHSTHQSAHPCCFLICSHSQGPRRLQNYSEERSPHPIRTSSGMHTRGSFPEPS